MNFDNLLCNVRLFDFMSFDLEECTFDTLYALSTKHVEMYTSNTQHTPAFSLRINQSAKEVLTVNKLYCFLVGHIPGSRQEQAAGWPQELLLST